MKNINLLAIGDTAVDVFIKINNAEASCDLSGDHCKLCLNYGGKIPYESAEVCPATGNSANVAICASRLGLKSALMTNVGDDQNGIDCLNKLKKENVETFCVKTESSKPTNYHYVLWYEKEHTILTKHEKYNYEWIKTKESEEYDPPTWVYLSSLGDDCPSFYNEIIDYLTRHTKVKLAFSPGSYQIKLGTEKLADIYKNTEVFICNHQEAQEILKIEQESVPLLTKMMHDLGPKIVVITNGIKGAYAYDGKDTFFMKSFTQPAYETTGAGDAFSGAFVVALSEGKDISEALIWGMANAMSVVSHVGPHKGLLNREQIEEYVKNVLDENKPIII